MPILEASGVDKRFGAVVALQDARLAVAPGEVHVLIGSNGSGKSTLCKIIAGSVVPDAGNLQVEGHGVTISGPRDAERAGIKVFYQELSLVPQLSVEENLFLNALPRRGPGLLDRGAMRNRAVALVAQFAGVTGDGFNLDTPVQELRNDQRQIVEILKTIATDARIYIFDEPTSSLDKRQVTVFFNLMRQLRAQGKAIIFISHRMDEIFEVGDRVTVLRDGRTVACLRLAATDRDTLVEHMVGGRIAAAPSHPSSAVPSCEGAVMEVNRLAGHRLADISLTLRRGEILGFGGLHGQGQSRVLRILFGAETAADGQVRMIDGRRPPRKPADAIQQGLAYVSGDRGRDGVLLARSILENLVAADLTKRKRFLLSPRGMTRQIEPIVKRLKMRFSGFGAPISSLSGGNQQKTVLARALSSQPKVLVVAQPTRGLDVGATEYVHKQLLLMRDEGVAILLVSADLDEVRRLSDRIGVLFQGELMAEKQASEYTEEELGLLMSGSSQNQPGLGDEVGDR